MASEQAFLARVSARLGRRHPDEAGRVAWRSPLLERAGALDPAPLTERFATEVERVGGVVHRALSRAHVGPLIRDLLTAEGLQGLIVRWEDPTLDDLGLDGHLEAAGFQVVSPSNSASLVGAAERAVAGITGCDAAIAETGSLVLGSHAVNQAAGAGRGRVVSLLPPVHVAVVYPNQIVRDGGQVMCLLAAAPLPPQVVFVSGPSRSADIENDLSIGVHGPRQVYVIIVEG